MCGAYSIKIPPIRYTVSDRRDFLWNWKTNHRWKDRDQLYALRRSFQDFEELSCGSFRKITIFYFFSCSSSWKSDHFRIWSKKQRNFSSILWVHRTEKSTSGSFVWQLPEFVFYYRRKKMNKVLERIQKIGIVPVVVLHDAKDAAPLAESLC